MIFLLSGCSKSDLEPPVNEFSEPPAPVFSVTENSSNALISEENTPQISEPDHGTEPIPDSGEMILSHDPRNRIKASFVGNIISVSGSKRGENCSISVYFDVEDPKKINNFGYFNIESDEEGFFSEYDCSELAEGDYTVTIDFIEDSGWTYYELPVHKSAEKIAPADNSEIVQNNTNRANAAQVLPNEVVAEYIVPGRDPEEIKRVLNEITEISNEICEGINDDYEKLRAISQWVSENIYYDLDALGADSTSTDVLSLDYVLKNKRSLCGGFSNITAALCAVQGIDCYNVHGIKLRNTETLESAKSNDPHQCNFAVINGRRIWVDTLWNKGGQAQTKYFDISGEFFAYEYKVTVCEFRNYFELI